MSKQEKEVGVAMEAFIERLEDGQPIIKGKSKEPEGDGQRRTVDADLVLEANEVSESPALK